MITLDQRGLRALRRSKVESASRELQIEFEEGERHSMVVETRTIKLTQEIANLNTNPARQFREMSKHQRKSKETRKTSVDARKGKQGQGSTGLEGNRSPVAPVERGRMHTSICIPAPCTLHPAPLHNENGEAKGEKEGYPAARDYVPWMRACIHKTVI